MPHVSLKEILVAAREKRYGVPSLLGGNLEMVIGQVMAAEEKSAPLILAYNQEVTPEVPVQLGISLIVNAAEKAKVPVATILDHGRSFDSIIKAIRFGICSVMFDGSDLPYEENVRKTREVVQIAHAAGVCVESELGAIAGSAVSPEGGGMESSFTDPDLVIDFVENTGVDALAISFGNVHGTYCGEPFLDLELVKKISSLVKVPLVMHGGSGLDRGEYRKIVENGISKIGYYTAMARGASDYLRKMMADVGKNTVLYHDLISWAVDYFYEETKIILDTLGASGTVKCQKNLNI
jgi:fructose-bisphosphate aldolase class II